MPTNAQLDAATAQVQTAAQAAQASDTALASAHVQAVWTAEMLRFLTAWTFGFMAFAVLVCAVLLWRTSATGLTVLRVIGIVTIIGLSALLLFVGYSNEQLTPIVGLFGAIAGYLLGKDSPPAPAAPPPASAGQ